MKAAPRSSHGSAYMVAQYSSLRDILLLLVQASAKPLPPDSNSTDTVRFFTIDNAFYRFYRLKITYK